MWPLRVGDYGESIPRTQQFYSDLTTQREEEIEGYRRRSTVPFVKIVPKYLLANGFIH